MSLREPLRILVVDDDADAADSMAELFELDGHHVTVAYDGDAAIRAYRDTSFDIAFMDIMMPGRNGVESFFEIRKLRPDARVYMMTGYSVEQLVQQAIDNGAIGVLSKPISAEKLHRALKEARPEGVVLVAEDTPGFARQLTGLVTQRGYAACLVTDVHSALEQADRQRPDVLILDIRQPVIDGLEVYTRLKARHAAILTIIVTGHAGDHTNTFEAMRDIAVTGILNKPYDPAELLDRLQHLAA